MISAMTEQPFGPFHPYTPHDIRAMLHDYPCPWWIAGGWAIDLYLGEITRPHADVDIECWREDAQRFRAFFPTWEVWAPHPDLTGSDWPFVTWPHDAPPPAGIFQAWCRPDATAPWAFEVMLADHDAINWLFRRDPAITRPRQTIIHISADGIPSLAPEIQLLYKAKQCRPKDEQDLRAALPMLGDAERAWLATALRRLYGEHAWVKLVEGA
jgi:hypothetical protein